MRIVTFCKDGDFGTAHALTLDEFTATPIGAVADWDEYVWQEQPSKEAAINRHDTAFTLWRDEQDAGKPEREFY